MNSEFMYDRCKAYVACRLSEGDPDKLKRKATPPPSITITRKKGSRALPIAVELADYLNKRPGHEGCPWTVFDDNLVERILQDHNLPQQIAAYMPEDRVGEVEGMIGEILGLHPATWTLFHHTVDTILRLAKMGHTILVGRGANLITASLRNTYHIRLIGSMEKRIQHVMFRHGVTETQAKTMIVDRDNASRRFHRQHFDTDNDDPLLYHLTVNTDEMPDLAVARLIGDGVMSLHAFRIEQMAGSSSGGEAVPQQATL